MLIFLKLNFNKIELQVELDISNVEFYALFATSIFLKIQVKLDIANLEFHLKI